MLDRNLWRMPPCSAWVRLSWSQYFGSSERKLPDEIVAAQCAEPGSLAHSHTMNSSIAMAGLAEAAFSQQLLMCWAGLIFICAFLIAAAIRRSHGIAGLVIGLAVLFGGAFEPWSAFASVSGDDPDLVYWISRYRIMATVWIAVIVAAVALIILFRVFPKRGTSAPQSFP